MHAQPHFSSHAEQQAMLGCAANLDPHKHPRRWALHQARAASPRKTITAVGKQLAEHQATRDELAPKVRELAAKLNQTEIAKQLGISRTTLRQIGAEHDIQFRGRNKPAPWPAEQVAAVKHLAASLCISDAAKEAGVTISLLQRIAKAHGFAFQPAPNHKYTKAELDKLAERITACRDLEVPRGRAARALGIAYDTFLRVCAEYDIDFPAIRHKRPRAAKAEVV